MRSLWSTCCACVAVLCCASHAVNHMPCRAVTHVLRPTCHAVPCCALQDTKLAVSQQQEREWLEKEQAAGGSSGSSQGYHFICEVFFMTLQVGRLAGLRA